MPPPVSPPRRFGLNRRSRIVVALALLVAIVMALPVLLMVTGLLRPFAVPSEGMRPAISGGDRILVENFTYQRRKPGRGDIVVFKTAGLELPDDSTYFLKRVVGEPGDRVRLSDGVLFVNDRPTVLSNAAGAIHYVSQPMAKYFAQENVSVSVPEGKYFVLGDNSPSSLDSRFWGFLPAGNIVGRACFCYSPASRVGPIK